MSYGFGLGVVFEMSGSIDLPVVHIIVVVMFVTVLCFFRLRLVFVSCSRWFLCRMLYDLLDGSTLGLKVASFAP